MTTPTTSPDPDHALRSAAAATWPAAGGPLPRWTLPLTVPLSWGYRALIDARNRRFDRGSGVHRLAVPVISIGNITTGGTGKTPMVAWICETLRSAGHHPLIGMRGYGAAPGRVSDEQAEYAERLPAVPVVTGADRAAAIREVLPEPVSAASSQTVDPSARDWPAVDCVVMDDGFQHRQLARDLDIVLIDATRTAFADRLLPAGHLREPPANLSRADAVVVTRAAGIDDGLALAIKQRHGRPPVAWCRERWSRLRVISAAADEFVETGWLQGRRIMLVLGLGNPAAVERMAAAHGARVVDRACGPDHWRYRRDDVRGLARRAAAVDAVLTTLKDWVKLSRLIDPASWPSPIVVPCLELELFHGADDLRNMVIRAASASGAR